MVSMRTRLSAIGLVLGVAASSVMAQQPPPGADPLADAIAVAAKSATVTDQPFTMVYGNRRVVEYRATVLTRSPQARAA